MIEKITELRIKIDGFADLLNTLEGKTPHIYYAQDSLFYGKAWLGKCLAALGKESPYQNDGEREGVADIEPTADTGKVEFEGWVDMNKVKKVDTLREAISKVIAEPYISDEDYKCVSMKECRARTAAYINLCEARFQLGFELEYIRGQEELNHAK